LKKKKQKNFYPLRSLIFRAMPPAPRRCPAAKNKSLFASFSSEKEES
jgi:hypothetical protein